MAVRGLLIDLEGVLYQGDAPVAGAVDAVARLAADGLGIRFLTNTTTRPRRVIVGRLEAMGFAAARDHVFSPPAAACRLLAGYGTRRVHLAAPATLAEEFADFTLVDEDAEAVVMGDLHTGFTWERLDALFGMVSEGARLVALHRNRFCRRGGAIALDLGPFVAALEYAAGIEAEVVGKPSAPFFRLALDDLGLGADEVVMVGDDIEADIGGAHAAGIRAIQVRTGKFTDRDLAHPTVTPDALIASIAELPDALSSL